MINVDFNEIGVFIKVVQSGSFTGAAKHLEMPISTVSAKVASLEKRIGVTLLQRTTRQLKLTHAGEIYYGRCLNGIEEILEAENVISLDQKEPQGNLKITSPTYLGSSLLPEVVSEIVKNYPKINVELVLTDEAVDLISAGIDVAIRAGEMKDSSLMAKKIGDLHFMPFASHSYLKANGTPKHPKDLADHNCVHFAPLGKSEWFFTNNKNRVKVKVDTRITVNELNVSEALASSGQGVALLPSFVCNLDHKNENLIKLLPEWRTNVRPLYLVYPPQRFTSPKVKIFLEVASSYIKSKL